MRCIITMFENVSKFSSTFRKFLVSNVVVAHKHFNGKFWFEKGQGLSFIAKKGNGSMAITDPTY